MDAIGKVKVTHHREKEWFRVFDFEILVLKLLAIDRLTTGTVVSSEVTTLDHKSFQVISHHHHPLQHTDRSLTL